jgi:hypothetical protein
MTKLWVIPRAWEVGEFNTDLKMQEISNSLEWLKDRPNDNKRTTNLGSNFSQAMTGVGNWFAINDTLLTMTITTAVANERVLVWLKGNAFTTGAAGQSLYWDVLLDDTNYASSGAPTAPLGLDVIQNPVTTLFFPFIFMAYITIPTAGVHTIKHRWAGTNAITFIIATSTAIQLASGGALDI